MNKILFKILPALIIISCLFLAGFVSYFLNYQITSAYTKLNPKKEISNNETGVLGVSSVSLSPLPVQSSIPSSTPKPSPSFKPKLTNPVITNTTPTPNPSVETKTFITNNYTTIVSTPIPTPSPSYIPTPLPIPSATPAPSLVSVEIKAPDRNMSFNLEITDGINACDLLIKAKEEGKITSLILDDSYLSTYKTLLVKEINGLSNYWVFTVNGEAPMGCSLVTLKNNDQVVWEYVDGGAF